MILYKQNRIYFILLLLLFLAYSKNGFPKENEVTWTKIRKNLSSIKDFKANYLREFTSALPETTGFKKHVAIGTFYYKKPYYIRLDQLKPTSQQLIANEENIWWYKPEDKEVLLYPAGEVLGPLRPFLDFINGSNKIEENFSIKRIPSSGHVEEFHFVLYPRQEASFQTIEIWFIPETFMPWKFSVIENSGDKTVFKFSNIQINIDLPVKLFKFSPPIGTRIVRPLE